MRVGRVDMELLFGVHGVEKEKQEGNQQKYGKKTGKEKVPEEDAEGAPIGRLRVPLRLQMTNIHIHKGDNN
ncbi:hypothetical protein A2U01_0040557 [Trifolium medium]|uniref:Uncharacterized protein n=1 Tax=Trifolium medium TaxID=97028 RepID=A0A392Q4Z4_9FABA|nr:hypothetical protein [Trifolium medium]